MFKILLRTKNLQAIRTFSTQLYSKRKEIYKEELDMANKYYPKFVDQICSLDFIQEIPGFSERYKTLLNQIVNNNDTEKMSTVLLTLYTYRRLNKPENLTPDNLERLCATGWAMRMAEAGMIIYDDVVDDTDIRYNKPSWKTRVGSQEAITDTHWLNYASSFILHHYLTDHPQLSSIAMLLSYHGMRSCAGQILDLTRIKSAEDVNWFEHRSNKTSYIIDVPVRSAMFLSHIENLEYHEKIKAIMVAAGRFISTQNDFWGMYSTFDHLKTGCTDIPNGTNTWLFSKAVELSDPMQKKVLLENYGKSNDESIQNVKDIYCSLKLDVVYEDFVDRYLADLHDQIEKLPAELPKDLFHDIIDLVPKAVING